jgi:hypothetical protein
MPVDGFEWVKDLSIFTSDFILNYDKNAHVGYILQVDVEIPSSIHDYTNDYPLMPEHLIIDQDVISPKSSRMRSARGYSEKFSSKKLAPNLFSKKCYVTHLRALQFALREGVEITQIRSAISFNQSPWIRDYVMLNTLKRRSAIDEYEKNLFKLLVSTLINENIIGFDFPYKLLNFSD